MQGAGVWVFSFLAFSETPEKKSFLSTSCAPGQELATYRLSESAHTSARWGPLPSHCHPGDCMAQWSWCVAAAVGLFYPFSSHPEQQEVSVQFAHCPEVPAQCGGQRGAAAARITECPAHGHPPVLTLPRAASSSEHNRLREPAARAQLAFLRRPLMSVGSRAF